jgi:S1-C subfamily serine protease
MSGPKHLWSGDWQRESEAASATRAQRAPKTAEPEPAEPATEKIPPGRPRRQLKRPRLSGTTVVVAAAVLVLAGAAFGLSSLLGSSSPRPRHPAVASATAPTVPAVPGVPALPTPTTPPAQTSPQTQTQTSPQTSQVAATPMVNWLGMQIATQPPGAAVVQTVRIGSPADRAGINPGEIIEAINGRAINSAQDIAAAVRGLRPAARVTLQLAYGSGNSEAQLTLGAPPSVAP